MKRLILAGLVLLPLALSRTGARADSNDAYGSLIGMADSASSDKGPNAGEIPPDDASITQHHSSADSSEDAPKTDHGTARVADSTKRAPARAAKQGTSKEEDAPVVSVPVAAAPRMWTKVFSSLIPTMTRASFFEIAVSTVVRRIRPEPARPATAASDAGRARGILELVAAATAPISPER